MKQILKFSNIQSAQTIAMDRTTDIKAVYIRSQTIAMDRTTHIKAVYIRSHMITMDRTVMDHTTEIQAGSLRISDDRATAGRRQSHWIG